MKIRSCGFRSLVRAAVVLSAVGVVWVGVPVAAAQIVIPGGTSVVEGALFDHVAAPVLLAYDDGEADGGLFPIPPDERFELAMRFDASEPSSVTRIDLCLQRQFAEDSASGGYEVRLYEAGPSAPGAVLASYEVGVFGVPVTDLQGSYVSLGFPTPQVVPASFYIGVELDAATSDFGFCVDRDSGERPILLSSDDGATWGDAALGGVLMVRPEVEFGGAAIACDAGSDAIFLLGNRSRVDVCYRTNNGDTGTGKLSVVDGTGATLWFFNPNNPEIFVKVRNACVDPFQRYWFFAAGLTDVEVAVTVTDTVAGQTETYFSTLGQAFPSVQDTNSFDTCP